MGERTAAEANSNFRCWLLGVDKKKNHCGHGQITIPYIGPKLAHRISYAVFVSEIPAGMNVLHHCDNRSCINPSHLFIGTQADNVTDMIQKGRMVNPTIRCGESNPSSKLTLPQVEEIRSSYVKRKVTLRQLGLKYGVSQAMVSMIVNGQRWSTQ